jgi:hypothetical protein
VHLVLVATDRLLHRKQPLHVIIHDNVEQLRLAMRQAPQHAVQQRPPAVVAEAGGRPGGVDEASGNREAGRVRFDGNGAGGGEQRLPRRPDDRLGRHPRRDQPPGRAAPLVEVGHAGDCEGRHSPDSTPRRGASEEEA